MVTSGYLVTNDVTVTPLSYPLISYAHGRKLRPSVDASRSRAAPRRSPRPVQRDRLILRRVPIRRAVDCRHDAAARPARLTGRFACSAPRWTLHLPAAGPGPTRSPIALAGWVPAFSPDPPTMPRPYKSSSSAMDRELLGIGADSAGQCTALSRSKCSPRPERVGPREEIAEVHGHLKSSSRGSRPRGDRPVLLPRGRPTCQQIVSNDPARGLASHHSASSGTLPEQG
jgi:hypothetical protein